MRAISPNRRTGVATHVFSPSEQLRETGSPRKSTSGSMSPLQFGQDLVKVSEPEATIGYFVRSTAAIELWPTTPSRIPAGRQKARDRRSPRAPCRALWRAESRAWEMSSTGLFGGWSKALAACQFNDVSACSR